MNVIEPPEPELPAPDAKLRCPAVEAARVILARKLIRARRALGWTQAELARRAGVRVETLNRLEHGKHSPNVATVDKLSRALRDHRLCWPPRRATYAFPWTPLIAVRLSIRKRRESHCEHYGPSVHCIL